MPDEIDAAQERDQLYNEVQLANARAKATLSPGEPGDCDICGEWSGRLVRGACCPCRDKYRLG